MTTFRRQTSGALLAIGVSSLGAAGACSTEPSSSTAPNTAGTGAASAGSAGQSHAGSQPLPNAGGEAGVGGCDADSCAGSDSKAGAGGEPAPQPCDQACLDSVVNQPSDFGMTWASSWFLFGCKRSDSTDCLNVPVGQQCPNQNAPDWNDSGLRTIETFPVGGIAGRRYKVTFSFHAIAGAKEYQGGTRDQGGSGPSSNYTDISDTFYRDGEPIPSNYDPWKLSVFDENGAEVRHYYMNSFPTGGQYEGHIAYLISFTKSIVVVGGGNITHVMHDPNCHAISNCGPNDAAEYCVQSRMLPNEPEDLELPAMYLDASDQKLKPLAELTAYPTAAQPWHSQLGHLTVTKVEETTDPVTHDYL